MELYKSYREYLPWFIAGLVVLIASIILIHFSTPYSSDHVATQVMNYWARHNHISGTTWLAPDTFVLKLPLYYFFDALGLHGRSILGLMAIGLNGFGFGILGLALIWFAKRFSIKPSLFGLIFITTCSVAQPLLIFLMNANFRNAEFGGIILIIGWIFYLYRSPRSILFTTLSAITVALYGGILAYSDPYFLYTFIAPTLLFFVFEILWTKSSRPALIVITTLFGAIGISKICAAIFTSILHYHLVGENSIPTFVHAEDILPNLAIIIQNILMMYDGSFFHQEVLKLHTFKLLLNALYVAALGALALFAVKHSRQQISESNDRRLLAYLGWLAIFTPLIYLVSQSSGIYNYRYFVFDYFILPFLALYGLSRLKNQRHAFIIGGLIIAAGITTFATTLTTAATTKDKPNVDNYVLIQKIQSHGISKGYSTYWDAPINTYLSDNKLLVIQSLCSKDSYRPFYWWLPESDMSILAPKSFILINQSSQPCDEELLRHKFGKPAERETYLGHYIILYYNYDVGTKMDEPYIVKQSSS